MEKIVFSTEFPSKKGVYLYRKNKNKCPVYLWYNSELSILIPMVPGSNSRLALTDIEPGSEFCFLYNEEE
jgi:hypothetical protein